MKKFFTKSILMLAAAALMLSSCVSENILPEIEPPISGTGERSVSLRIVDSPNTRIAASRPICDGEPVQFNGGDLYLITAAGVISRHYTIGDAATADICIVELKEDGVDIESVPGNVTRVVIVGNHQGTLPTTGLISSVTGQLINISTQHHALVPGVNMINCPVFTFTPEGGGAPVLNGNLVYTGNTLGGTVNINRLYTTHIRLAPTVARFEIASITGLQGEIHDFEIEGIFMDRYFRHAQISGAIPAATGNFISGEQIESNFTNTSGRAMFSWNAPGGGGLGARTTVVDYGRRATPGTIADPWECKVNSSVTHTGVPNVWGYHVFAHAHGITPQIEPPRIVIRLRNVYLHNAANPAAPIPYFHNRPHFVTVRGFTVTAATGLHPSGRLTHILPSHVYRVSDILFGLDNLSPYPNCDGIEVEISVSMDWWNERPTLPNMPLRQPNPGREFRCPGVTDIQLDPASGGRGDFLYTWQRSTDRVAWDDIVTGVASHNLMNWNFDGEDVWIRRIAIDQHNAANYIISSAGLVTLPELSTDFPEYVLIGTTRWATRNVDLSTTTGFAYHPVDAGMLFQWSSNIGWDHSSPVVDGRPTRRWCPIEQDWIASAAGDWRTRAELTGIPNWDSHQGPCPIGWRLPSSAELSGLLTNSPLQVGSATIRGQWMRNHPYGEFACQAGSRYGHAPNQIFLPAPGRRASSGAHGSVGAWGIYWSSAQQGAPGAQSFHVTVTNPHRGSNYRDIGASVRCVRR